MGAWGTGPYDNDTAADWFFKITEKAAPDLIAEGLESESYEEVRAAAWLLQQIGYNYVYPLGLLDEHKQLAIKKLSTIVQDKDWIGSWKEPQIVYSSIMAQIYDLGKKK